MQSFALHDHRDAPKERGDDRAGVAGGAGAVGARLDRLRRPGERRRDGRRRRRLPLWLGPAAARRRLAIAGGRLCHTWFFFFLERKRKKRNDVCVCGAETGVAGAGGVVGVGRRPGPAAGVAPQLRRVAALLRLPLAAVRPLLALLAHVQQPSIVL